MTARQEGGASAVEYSFIVASIAAVIVVLIFSIGKFTGAAFDDTCDSLASGEFTGSDSCP